MRAIIVANGELHVPPSFQGQLKLSDIIIAADGGARHCLTLGIEPSIVIGDLDSITRDQQRVLDSPNTQFIVHPKYKDQTDLELALNYVNDLGINDILLIGFFGGRLDQTVANLLLLTKKDWNDFQFTAINGLETAYLIQDQGSLIIDGEMGNTVSLIPLTNEVTAIHTNGLRWSLQNARMIFGSTLGVSNEMVNNSCHIQIGNGKLLVIHTKIQHSV